MNLSEKIMMLRKKEGWSQEELANLYMGTIPILAQGFRREELDYPLIDRVVFATYSLIEYLTKCLIPIKLFNLANSFM